MIACATDVTTSNRHCYITVSIALKKQLAFCKADEFNWRQNVTSLRESLFKKEIVACNRLSDVEVLPWDSSTIGRVCKLKANAPEHLTNSNPLSQL